MCCRPPASTRGCPGRWRGEMAGTLYVVATPLGNLGDLSPRAADTLKRVAAVAAEDTRHSKPLLHHAGSKTELISLHEPSSEQIGRAQRLNPTHSQISYAVLCLK